MLKNNTFKLCTEMQMKFSGGFGKDDSKVRRSEHNETLANKELDGSKRQSMQNGEAISFHTPRVS